MSTPRQIAETYVNDLKAVEITTSGSVVEIECVDEFQARDLAASMGLLLADKAVNWGRVVYEFQAEEVASVAKQFEAVFNQTVVNQTVTQEDSA